MSERIHSVATFRAELAAVVREYLTHVEPTAPSELLSLRLEVTGPYLNVTLDVSGDNEPNLQISMNGRRDDIEPSERKGMFR